VALIIVCGCLGAPADEKVLAAFPNDELSPFAATYGRMPGVMASVDSAAPTGGNGSIKVTFSGGPNPEVLLFGTKLSGVEDCVLWYEATMKSEGVTGRAYLDMWMTFPDGKSYFSRGLDQVFTGTQDWRRCRIPFFLKMGESPSSAAMGVQFEGTGAVWLNDVRLMQERNGIPPAGAYPSSAAVEENQPHDTGLVGARRSLGPPRPSLREWLNRLVDIRSAMGGYGILVSAWGAAAGVLASIGRGRRSVMISGIGFLLFGILLIAAGLFCLFSDYGRHIWLSFLLWGAFGVVLFGLLLPVVLRRYRQVEAQRLQAQDLAADL